MSSAITTAATLPMETLSRRSAHSPLDPWLSQARPDQLMNLERGLLPLMGVLTAFTLFVCTALSALLLHGVLPAPVPLAGPILVLSLTLSSVLLPILVFLKVREWVQSVRSRIWILLAAQ